ncbi:hypothetical protein MEX01_28380 [Methylorubrum extorquens]|uniref:hypothetical protein n=1 Tax=Methylorubrum extorquens TaxID=408 RepID=UPI00116D6811|nr:hypothetical protein [Methylorubrum extorquens]GEL42247.1 hypothetical protein MEX01_28380 [Methylorubrum extorquens]
MTAINALVRRDRVHVVTDGAVYQPDGAVVGSMQKVYILAHADAVMAYRGPSYIGPTLYGCLNAASLTGFDDLLSKLIPAVLHTLDSLELLDPMAVAEASALLDLRRADVVVAGWSRSRGRGEIYKLDTSAEVWRFEPQADGFMMPGDNPALIARLEAHGWDLADERQDERRLLELLNHQRAVADILPDGARFSTVGAFAQHTVVTAAGISTRIVERWATDSVNRT